MANTGIKTVLTLRKYVDGVATSETKVNDPGDPDYIAPYEDLVDCPTGESTTTQSTTATTGTTQSTTATTETTGTTQSTTGTTQSTTATTAPPNPITSFVIYGNSSSQGFNTADEACTGADTGITVYNDQDKTTAEGAWISATVLYSDSEATTIFNGQGKYFTDGVGYSFQVTSGGTITTRAICEAAQGTDPLVITQSTSDSGTDFLVLTGNVTVVGDPNFTSKGFIWAEGTDSPTLSDNVVTVDGTGIGQYTKRIINLTPGTQYTYRAFVIQEGVYFEGSDTTTITNLVGYYQLRDCTTLSTNFRSGDTIEDITLATEDRVTAGGNTYTVVGSTNDTNIPSVGTVTYTGEPGCPTNVRYYNMSLCSDPGVTFVGVNNSSENLATGSSLENNGTCYKVETETTTSGLDTDITSWTRHNDCAACNAATAIPCYEYQASVPTQSGESLEITYIDCDGVEQDILYYWNSGVSSVTFCARSIVGANYPVTGPGAQCGGNQPLPTTQATTATTTLNPTCHEVTYDSSVFNLDQDRYGIAYVDYLGVFTTATFNGMLSSPNGSELIYYVCATTVGNDVWDVTSNPPVAVPQYNSSLVSYDSGTACDGFCSPPGGGGL
jgi:hypothetical protein